ncbi:DUF2516 family protein [Quadrisphaera sp. DSM 44207]|uniref:DUF2516 family protein n=1 Tax=Quadrisphaera sp. DSM 44207 TaxID=1881057 RepID=UPI00088F5181|nr:DUF2516 family protein [Quadrisphaera sp. DSM 44207]SDQ83823.1 Protein of unknown function [Quadrisphaera sp. DSM 44207]
MGIIGAGQTGIFWLLSIAAFAFELWALVEASRFGARSYTAAGKQTKNLWVGVLAVATALGFLALPIANFLSVLSFLSILSVAAAGIFMAGVRPALRAVQGRGGSSGGPYGGW